MGRRITVTHDFYCINCGKKGLPVARKQGHQHGRLHMKKLFCLTCKEEVNHVECKNYADVLEFKEKFEQGDYVQAAAESLAHIRNLKTSNSYFKIY